jgi:hypothetical protein
MKWILLIMGIGIFRGILFPDYRFQPNIVIIPFGLPLLLAALSAYLGATRRLSWLSVSIWGLFSVYLSTLVGIFVYGMSVGWKYVIDDTESQAVFMATIGIQTITFVLGLGVSSVLAKRYNKAIKPDAP